MRYIAPHIFFFFQDDEIAVCDYVNQQRYTLEKRYLDRLVQIACGGSDAEIDAGVEADLLQAGLVSADPFPPVEWAWGKSSEIYHYGSKNLEGVTPLSSEALAHQYLDLCEDLSESIAESDIRSRRSGERVILPAPAIERLQNVSLWDAIANRKTTREFLDNPITLEELSLVLYASFGEIHGRWNALEDQGLRVLGIRKACPSGGATHSVQAYIVSMRVEGLARGIFHYESDTHNLIKISDMDCRDTLGEILAGQNFANQLGAGIFLTSRLDRVWAKYKDGRAYVVPYIDLGHLSQMFHLTANAIGLNSWLSGMFLDEEVSALLELEPVGVEQPLFFVGMGNGTGEAFDPSIKKAIQQRRETRRATT